MNLRLSVLTLIRSPIKTLITFALLVATSFAFVSRSVEYLTTEQVITDAESEYVAVGTLVGTKEKYEQFFNWYAFDFDAFYGPNNHAEGVQYFSPISEEAIDLVLSSGYIKSSEVRHVAGGITSDDIWTVMETPLGFSNDTDTHALDNAIVIAYCYTTVGDPSKWTGDFNEQRVVFYTIEEVLAGDPELWPVGEIPEFYVDEDGRQSRKHSRVVHIQVQQFDQRASALVEGHRYVMALSPMRWAQEKYYKEITGAPFTGKEEIPNRLLDLTLLEEEKGAPVTYEDYAYFLEDRYGALMLVNHHKQELVYTQDMSLLPRFHDGSLYITEGRALTADDDGYVCVINANYAARNGIKVGDTIDFDVDPNTMVYFGEVFARDVYEPLDRALGARYTKYELEQEQRSYEVVGIWTAAPQDGGESEYADPDALKYPLNTVFVPEATYPWADEVEAHRFPVTFSFELEHPGYMRNLEAELGDKLEAMGYKLAINDMGYSEVGEAFSTMRVSALIGLVSMGAALLLSLILITYLFIVRRKSEYAIMRALGVPSGRAGLSLLAGLFAMAAAAVAVGCVAATFTLRGYAMDLAASMAEVTGEAASVSYSPWMIGAFGVGVLALLMIFAVIGLGTVGKKPPLELLQDSE